MPGFAIALQALNYAERNIHAWFRCFWPSMLCFIILMWAGSALKNMTRSITPETAPEDVVRTGWLMLVSGVGILVLYAYAILLFSSGAILWHRYMVLNETAVSPPLWPVKRSGKYTVYAIVYSLGGLIFLLPAVWLNLSYHFSNKTAGGVPQMVYFEPHWLILTSAVLQIVGTGIFLVIARKWLLLFPYVAVAERPQKSAVFRQNIKTPDGVVSAVFVICTAGTLVQSAWLMVMPHGWEPESLLAKLIYFVVSIAVWLFFGAIPLVVLSQAFKHVSNSQLTMGAK